MRVPDRVSPPYQHCKVKDIKQTTNHLENVLSHLLKGSKEKIFVFNPSKTKLIIIGTKKIARLHDLEKKSVQRKTKRTSIQF